MNKLEEVMIKQVKTRTYYSEERISGPEQAIKIIQKEFGNLDREVLIIINLNIKNMTININLVSMGIVNEALVHPREVLKSAILSNASFRRHVSK